MNRLEKIERDMEKAQEKIAEWQGKLKELDGQRTEQENLQIISAIRALKMTRAELRTFMATGKLPVALAGAAAIPAARFERKKPEAKTEASAEVPDERGKDDEKSGEGKITNTIITETEGKTNEE